MARAQYTCVGGPPQIRHYTDRPESAKIFIECSRLISTIDCCFRFARDPGTICDHKAFLRPRPGQVLVWRSSR